MLLSKEGFCFPRVAKKYFNAALKRDLLTKYKHVFEKLLTDVL